MHFTQDFQKEKLGGCGWTVFVGYFNTCRLFALFQRGILIVTLLRCSKSYWCGVFLQISVSKWTKKWIKVAGSQHTFMLLDSTYISYLSAWINNRFVGLLWLSLVVNLYFTTLTMNQTFVCIFVCTVWNTLVWPNFS